jgi:hypothetical protein
MEAFFLHLFLDYDNHPSSGELNGRIAIPVVVIYTNILHDINYFGLSYKMRPKSEEVKDASRPRDKPSAS